MDNNNQAQSAPKDEREQITIKFSKNLLGEVFTRKEDGLELRQVSIPNADPSDKSPWQTFVIRAEAARPDKFNEKLVYIKLPKDGTTTVRKSQCIGEDQAGKKVYVDHVEKISNMELKAKVEAYKTRQRESEAHSTEKAPEGDAANAEEAPHVSLHDRMQEKKEEVASGKKAATQEAGKTELPKVPKKSKKKDASL